MEETPQEKNVPSDWNASGMASHQRPFLLPWRPVSTVALSCLCTCRIEQQQEGKVRRTHEGGDSPSFQQMQRNSRYGGANSSSRAGLVLIMEAVGSWALPTRRFCRTSPASARSVILSIFLFRLYLLIQKTSSASRTKNRNPPTTDPTIFQTLDMLVPLDRGGVKLGDGAGARSAELTTMEKWPWRYVLQTLSGDESFSPIDPSRLKITHLVVIPLRLLMSPNLTEIGSREAAISSSGKLVADRFVAL